MSADERATALLDAHVAFQVARLRGPQFGALVRAEIEHGLQQAHQLTLEQVVDRAAVKAVAHKYVAAFKLPGAIPEIVGDVATRLRDQPANDTELGTVIARRHVAELAGKIAQLRAVREWIAVQVTESPGVQTWLAEYLRSLTTGAVDANLRLARKVPGVSLGLSIGNKVAGGAVNAADQRSREMSEKAAGALLQKWRKDILSSLADDDIADTILGVWDQAAPRRIGELLAVLPDEHLVDLISIGYDVWLDLRHEPYLLSLVDLGVDYVFDTYGGFPLDELLAEFGLAADDLVEEAVRFAPPVLDALHDAGLLEDLVRRQLAPFYESPEARALLG